MKARAALLLLVIHAQNPATGQSPLRLSCHVWPRFLQRIPTSDASQPLLRGREVNSHGQMVALGNFPFGTRRARCE